MIKISEEKKINYMSESELNTWLDKLSEVETFEIEIFDKIFKFKKNYSISIASEVKQFTEKDEQAAYLISYLSVEPKLTKEMVHKKLPVKYTKLISAKIKEFNPTPQPEPTGKSEANLRKEKTSSTSAPNS